MFSTFWTKTSRVSLRDPTREERVERFSTTSCSPDSSLSFFGGTFLAALGAAVLRVVVAADFAVVFFTGFDVAMTEAVSFQGGLSKK